VGWRLQVAGIVTAVVGGLAGVGLGHFLSSRQSPQPIIIQSPADKTASPK
jgi:hypothetical protein